MCCVSNVGVKLTKLASVFVWPIYLRSYCVCRARSLSRARSGSAYVSNSSGRRRARVLKSFSVHPLSFGLDVVCASFGSVKVLVARLSCLVRCARYYEFKLFGGMSPIGVAEPFITSGLISLVG